MTVWIALDDADEETGVVTWCAQWLIDIAPMNYAVEPLYGGFLNLVDPQNGWFIKGYPIKADDLGVPLF